MTLFPVIPGHSLFADRSIKKIPTIQVAVVAFVVPPGPVIIYRTTCWVIIIVAILSISGHISTFLGLGHLGCVFLCSTICARFIHFSLVVTFPGNLNSNGNVIT